jgi:predicted dehydrogenase
MSSPLTSSKPDNMADETVAAVPNPQVTSTTASPLPPPPSPPSPDPTLPRIIFIGAGSQGNAYAAPITRSGWGQIIGVCEPIPFKRNDFGRKYIWKNNDGDGSSSAAAAAVPTAFQSFDTYQSYIAYEVSRRARVASHELSADSPEFRGADAVFVCLLDELHVHAIMALAPLGLHIMCEKPLATSVEDCVGILGSVTKGWEGMGRQTVFGIGHVLRYSPQNMMLRRLVREEGRVGQVVSVEHTEPVGWWHMAHSFVRFVNPSFTTFVFHLCCVFFC